MATILIIDDEPDLITIMRTFLEETDHTVVEARNGVEGQEQIAEKEIDLVVADIVMPEQGGVEMAVGLAKLHPEIKWVLITGRLPVDSEPLQLLVKQFGIKEIIGKPFSREQFLDSIDAALAEGAA